MGVQLDADFPDQSSTIASRFGKAWIPISRSRIEVRRNECLDERLKIDVAEQVMKRCFAVFWSRFPFEAESLDVGLLL